MSTQTRFENYISSILPLAPQKFDYKDKEANINQHIITMLNRSQSMFKWSNLPQTIPQRVLELYLQINGHCCFYKHNGEIFVYTGGLGGAPDVYYMPTLYTIANPAQNLSENLKIGIDCVVMPSDSMYRGLLPIFAKYAVALAETELSMQVAAINSRIVNILSADDDSTFESAKKYLQDIEDGKQGIIAENAFLEGVKSQPYGYSGAHSVITTLIELEQYYKASEYNEIGLNANYNMKRESIMSDESALNEDALYPLIDNMLETRKEHAEKVNEMFGTDISVDLNSSWKDNKEALEAQKDNLETNPTKEDGENSEKEGGENGDNNPA